MSQVDGRSHQSSNARTHARLHSKFQRLLSVRVCLSFRARSWLETKGQEGEEGTEGVGEPLRKGMASGFEPTRSGFEPKGLSGTGKGTGIGWYRPGGGADADVPPKDAMWGRRCRKGPGRRFERDREDESEPHPVLQTTSWRMGGRRSNQVKERGRGCEDGTTSLFSPSNKHVVDEPRQDHRETTKENPAREPKI